MRKNILKVFFGLVTCLFIFLLGCTKPGNTVQNEGSGNSSNTRIRIENVLPSLVPSVTRDSFDVTVKGYDIVDSFKVHLEVRKHSGITCTAYVDSNLWVSHNNPSFTKKLRTDSLLSSCISQNSILRIAVWFRDSLDDVHSDSVYYQWGTPPSQNSTSASVERWRMPYVSKRLSDTLSKCIKTSFDPPDSNYLKLTVSFDSVYTALNDTNFMVSSDGELTAICDWFSQNNDSDGFVHNKVVYARFQSYNLYLVGWTQYTSPYPPSSYQNWSYIFMKNIDSACPPNGTRNDTTIANLTAVHEMIHQLGAIGDRGHGFHTGYFAYKCALWYGDEHFAYELANHRYSNRFRVCMQHTMQLRSFRGFVPFDNSNGSVIFTYHDDTPLFPIGAGTRNSENKYSMTMSLAKNEFKKYEPVIGKFALINHDSVSLDIYNLFENTSGEPDFFISDNKGNVYTQSNRIHNFISDVRTRLEPGDTLVFSMPINNWGKETKYATNLSFEDVYFDQFGYFPQGDYKVYFYLNPDMAARYGTSLTSNEVSFKVTDLTQEDEEVLRLYKQKNYHEILNKFPENPFAEHVWIWNMLPYWNKVTDNTETDYNQFISKYPNSSYLLSWRFMLPYLVSAEMKKGDFKKGVDYLLGLQKAINTVNNALTNKPFTTIIKSYGKQLDELK